MPLQLFFEVVFSFAQRFTHDPGLSIIFLSLAVNFLVLPLYKRADAIQAEQREIEKKMQPWVTHIKKTFSCDEKMMMLQAYYRINDYKPSDVLKESLPLLLQIPFFIAAYNFLSNLAALDGAAFGPISNLGMPDALLTVGGITVNLLPVLMTLINVISSMIYTRGFPLKGKLQLYITALVFLILLYTSPAGLVFYWTLNNLFSLVKNIFFKLKNPHKTLSFLSSATGALLMVYGMFFFDNTFKRKVVVLIFGCILQIPVILLCLFRLKVFEKIKEVRFPLSDKKQFLMSGILLTVLVGGLIPSAVIKSSPQEFIDVMAYHDPLLFILNASCIALGSFVVWAGVFYRIADSKGKVIIEKLMLAFCGVSIVDYLFFGTNLGIISSNLKFENDPVFSVGMLIFNLLVVIIVSALMLLVSDRLQRFIPAVQLTVIISLCLMIAINAFGIERSVKPVKESLPDSEDEMDFSFQLSKNGKNVIVLMLDRAIGPYVPYLFNERPEMKEQFDGFTYYSNTTSFGVFTNFGTPALFGGYEYTPVELNKRADESLKDKNNEALKVMPVLFRNNGFDVTVCEPPYAGYRWIPDTTIYRDYPEIKAYNTDGMFNLAQREEKQINLRRNFFFYSIMKVMPLFTQKYIYAGGGYNHEMNKNEAGVVQITDGISRAQGIYSGFQDTFQVLQNLERLTTITEEDRNTFMMMDNNSTHEPILLQEPEYLPAETVDNTAYDEAHTERFFVDGRKMNMDYSDHYAHYESNMATFIQLGKWFDYLRKNDVYDNTRIILVSDHARPLGQFDDLIADLDVEYNDIEAYTCLLMVKDFDSHGFDTSDEFMTNGDVPTIAFSDIIDDPVNPFTSKPINSREKELHDQYIISSPCWEITKNNGNQFLPGDWIAVHDDIWNMNNWRLVAKDSVFTGEE